MRDAMREVPLNREPYEMAFFGLDKIVRLMNIIKQNGGPRNSLWKLWRYDDLKEGVCVGTDMNGNTYYHNKSHMIGRSRWVEYHPSFNWDYEGSQVSPEWHGWLHYKTDKHPGEDAAKQYLYHCTTACKWLQPPLENLTGTDRAYYPYSTTRPKIQVWDGKSLGRY